MRPRAVSGERLTPLVRWELALDVADGCAAPAQAAALTGWIPAAAPGTTAAALRAAGLPFDDLHGRDVWWRTRLDGAQGVRTLRCDGLATLCEAWLDDRRLFRSETMFTPVSADVTLEGGETLWLAFRALAPRLAAKGPRARWRTKITPRQGFRGLRTTLAGQMPAWQPPIDAVGPWREVVLVEPGPVRLDEVELRATWTGEGGRLEVVLPPPLRRGGEVACGGVRAPLTPQPDGSLAAALELPGVRPWRPRGYGEQPLYPAALSLDGAEVDLGRVGFRSVAVDRGGDGRGFGLVVDGAPLFARGACWTSPDLAALPAARDAVEPWLRLAAEAGMTMIRVPGVMPYEAEPFFDLCDELGLMVWQDFAFANFDYPADEPAFAELVRAEARAFLRRTQAHPSLAVLCGGSEIAQQAAMMGLPEAARGSRLAEELLAQVAAEERPDLPYVAHSPGGGDLPFVVDAGVGHYYGVGAYRLPLSDARRAHVRFASECLAFANVPFGELPPAGSAAWKAGVPRDVGADWDFDDVRDHYLRELYGEDALELAARDPALFLDLSRAVSAEVMEATFAEWRRPGSPTRGGLVWTLNDLVPGAGWGVVDAGGAPKAAWYGLKRAFRPLKLTLTDEGVNGLKLHLLNDGPEPVEAELSLAALVEGGRPAVRCARAVRLAPRSGETVSAFAWLGAFFDFGYVYRFGPPAHDAVLARLTGADGEVLDEALHFPRGRRLPRPPPQVSAELAATGRDWTLTLETDRLAETVWVRAEGFRPGDDGFHLAPGAPRRVRLEPTAAAGGRPRGVVAACGGAVLARFG